MSNQQVDTQNTTKRDNRVCPFFSRQLRMSVFSLLGILEKETSYYCIDCSTKTQLKKIVTLISPSQSNFYMQSVLMMLPCLKAMLS